MLKQILKWQAARAFLRHTQPVDCANGYNSLKLCATRFFAQTVTDEHTGKTSPQEAEQPAKKHANPFAREAITPPTQTALSAEERQKRLKVLQLEVDIAGQEGRRVPRLDFFKDEHWEHILTLPSKSARSKYYSYLWQIEAKKESQERKKQERAEHVLQRKEELRRDREENKHIVYGLGYTSLFLRIYDSTINHWQNNRLTRAMQFAPKLVLDCSYDKYMTRREAQNAAKQLMLCFADNRAHDDPFDLHYCNVNLQSTCMEGLKRYIPTMLNPEFPMNVHEKCFTELFPKERLVYLTPHCRTDLEVYNADDVYIVGAMVDTVNNEPLSLAKAKRLGIRMARLPLDRYLQWGSGSGKSLTLNQMINIMLDLKRTGDWMKSLSHVPRRKVIDMDIEQVRQKRSLERRAEQLNFNLENSYESVNSGKSTATVTNVKKLRTHMRDEQFNLETWGSTKRKNRNSN